MCIILQFCATLCRSGGGEKYEKVHVHHGDIIFYKFVKNMSKSPKQIVRFVHSSIFSVYKLCIINL